MLLLPHVSASCGDSEFSFPLPCPVFDLVRLASCDVNDMASWRRLLRSNPSLLIYAAALQSPGVISAELISGLAELPSRPLFHIAKPPVMLSAVAEFLRSSKPKPLARSLRNFLIAAIGCRQQQSREILDGLLGDSAWLKWLLSGPAPAVESVLNEWQFAVEVSSGSSTSVSTSTSTSTSLSLYGDLDVAALFRHRRDWESLNANFQQELLRQKLAAMKQLAYGASHEINNPLANIATRAQTLLPDESNPERRHKLAVIYEQSLRAHEMISDLMLFANPPAPRLAENDLRLWLARLVRQIAPTLEWIETGELKMVPRKIEFSVHIGPGLTTFAGDTDQVSVALTALIRNAIESIRNESRADESGGEIQLRVTMDSKRSVCFSIVDSGPGVSDTAREHLFDPFFSGREAGRGLGFGLSKAYRIAELHGGSLTFDSQHQPGARFVLRLPQLEIPKVAVPVVPAPTACRFSQPPHENVRFRSVNRSLSRGG